MRIAVISTTPSTPCGVAEYSDMLVRELEKQGNIEVVLLGITKPLEKPIYSRARFVECIGKSLAESIMECIESSGGVDIVHIQHEYGIYPNRAELVKLLEKLKSENYNIVITLHTVIHSLGDYSLLSHQSVLVKLVDAIVVHSILQEHELLKQGVDPAKLFRFPHGTLLNPYVNERREELARSLGLEDLVNKNIITIPGFVKAFKKIEPVIEAVKMLSDYDVKAVIAGSARRESAQSILKVIEDYVEKNKDYAVLMKGFIPRDLLLKLLALSDVVVIPYIDDRKVISVSGVFHLAIGSRRPVICSRDHKLVECNTLTPELTLHTVNSVEIAEKIKSIVRHENWVEKTVEKLWNYAVETLWSRLAEKHVELYEKLTK